MAGEAYIRHFARMNRRISIPISNKYSTANHAQTWLACSLCGGLDWVSGIFSLVLLEHALHLRDSFRSGRAFSMGAMDSRAAKADGDRLRCLLETSATGYIPFIFGGIPSGSQNFWTCDRCRLGKLASSRCRNELPGPALCPSEFANRRRTVGGLKKKSGDLAGQGRYSALQSDSRYRQIRSLSSADASCR